MDSIKNILNAFYIPVMVFIVTIPLLELNSQTQLKASPIFEDGESQIVPAFSYEKKWIRKDLWVETDLDTDGDGKLDRMHVACYPTITNRN